MRYIKFFALFFFIIFPLGLTVSFSNSGIAGSLESSESNPIRTGVKDTVLATLSRLERIHYKLVDKHLSSMPIREKKKYTRYAEKLGLPFGKIMVSWSRYGIPRSINSFNLRLPTPSSGNGSKPLRSALDFLVEYKDLFQMRNPKSELNVKRTSTERNGNHHLFFSQVQNKLPVFGSELAVHLNPKNEIIGINGLYLPVVLQTLSPAISKEKALEIVQKDLTQNLPESIDIKLGIFNPEAYESKESPTLVWKATSGQFPNPVYFIDAKDGTVIHKYNQTETSSSLQIWRFTEWWSGQKCPEDAEIFVIGNDPPHWGGEWSGTSIYVFTGTYFTYQYFFDRHGRDSWDDNGATLYACSDYGSSPNSIWAGWSGGQGPTFGPCGACPDIIGHEFTHLYLHHLANLIGNIQSNSLRESFCDVFGELIEDYGFGPSDWEHGTKGSRETELCSGLGPNRSLIDPPSIGGDPDHWNAFNLEGGFQGHENCGISNKSAWLLGRDPAEGWVNHAGVSVRGIGPLDAGDIWYSAMANWLISYSNFTDFGLGIQNAAWSMYGLSNQYTQSRRSIMAIGLWSADNGQGFSTDHAVSLVPGFIVNGEWRKYIFYKEPDGVSPSPRLCFRYRTSALYGILPWSDVQYISNTRHAPSALVFEGKIWIFFKRAPVLSLHLATLDENDSLNHYVLNDGYSTTDQSPSATVFNNRIYVFCKSPGEGSTELNYFRYDGQWSGPFNTGFQSDNGPRVTAPLDDKLWLFWRNEADNSIQYSSMDSDENWDMVYTVPNGAKTYDTPAVAIHRERLHVATSELSNNIYYISCSLPCTQASDWSRYVKQDLGASPYMTLFKDIDGWLYLFHRSHIADTLLWRKKFSE